MRPNAGNPMNMDHQPAIKTSLLYLIMAYEKLIDCQDYQQYQQKQGPLPGGHLNKSCAQAHDAQLAAHQAKGQGTKGCVP